MALFVAIQAVQNVRGVFTDYSTELCNNTNILLGGPGISIT